jgi:hypothetical protein
MTSQMRVSRNRCAAALMLGLGMVGLAACGNAITIHDAGQVGITVDHAGRPVIMVMTCAKSTPVIDMAEGRKESDPDSKPNVERGHWRARQAFSGVRNIALKKPEEGWLTTRDPGSLESDRLFIVGGGTVEDKNASLTPVDFRTPDLTRLSPDQVLVNGKVEPISAFGDYRCR